MTIPALYSDGTISVANGDTHVTGVGTAFSSILKRGSLIISGQSIGVVASDADSDVPADQPGDLAFDLIAPWPGTSLVNSAYTAVIFRSGASFAEGFNDIISRLIGKGMGLVTSGQPLNTEGRDNDFRFDPATGILYFKVAGAWQAFSIQLHFDAYGANLAARTAYDGEAIGFTFFDESAEQWYVRSEAATGTWAGPFQFRGPQGGDRYDIGWSDRGKPLSGEILDPWLFTTDVNFPAGLGQSRAKATVANATGTSIYSLRKNGVEFGTVTFSPGNPDGVVTSSGSIAFAADDVMSVVAPNPADPTLSGVVMTITGSRPTS